MVRNIKKVKSIFLFTLLMLVSDVFATHYRAGEIIFRKVSGLNYEITVYTYTDQDAGGDAGTGSVEIDFGDNTKQVVLRTTNIIISQDPTYGIRRNSYTTQHTYTGPGRFLVSILDLNRVDKIRNINDGNSENVPFSVQSLINVNDALENQSPILLAQPIDRGCVSGIFVHNPGAYDPDGDSLAYEIRAPNLAPDVPVPGFTIPAATDSFTINQLTGQLTWSRPKFEGLYNIVIRIKEYRYDGKMLRPILIGYVDRDIQIRILICTNKPPQIASMSNACILAGDLLEKNISVSDKSDTSQIVTLSALGGPFEQNISPAFTTPEIAQGNPTGFLFRWRPSCFAIRADSFQAIFRAVDNGIPVSLTDVQSFKIKVNAPAPKNLKVQLVGKGFKLTWDPDTCKLAFGYNIYKRIDSSLWNPSYCQTGVPASTGFVLIDTVQGVNNTTYFDDNSGKGLSPLINFCYRVTAFYLPRDNAGRIVPLARPSESKASAEVCDIIKRTSPIITHVSVIKTDISKGAILVKWLSPLLDSTQYPAPYNVKVKRALLGSTSFVDVGLVKTYNTYKEIQNDSIVDSNINTTASQYYYKVVFANNTGLSEESIIASSIFSTTYNTDRAIVLNYKFDVPWLNTSYIIYKQNGTNFDSLAETKLTTFTDTGLVNGQTYCYYISSVGNYNQKFLPITLLNNSQIICGKPIDTISPCPPVVTYKTPCNQFNISNIIIEWKYPKGCKQDVKNYKIYYKKSPTDTFIQLAFLPANITSYIDNRPQLVFGIAGCYSVTAIDSAGNESNLVTYINCINNCPYYVLPNVFTPDGDQVNDIFKPFPYRFIEGIDIQIFNRWGSLVFATKDIDVNWDGKDMSSGAELKSGQYYYVLKIYENYLDRTRERRVGGSINLIRK
jgi:gliding motility-associated-like protein